MKIFFICGIHNSKYDIFDYEKKNFPKKDYDLIISLYSLDYHYDFNVYSKYLKSVSKKDTKIIFDTIRPEFFNEVFDNLSVIKKNELTVHKFKRIACTVLQILG